MGEYVAPLLEANERTHTNGFEFGIADRDFCETLPQRSDDRIGMRSRARTRGELQCISVLL